MRENMSKDKKQREQKKPKKDTRKIISGTNIETPPPQVEVIKRGKKEKVDF
jgi:hypothetical protein